MPELVTALGRRFVVDHVDREAYRLVSSWPGPHRPLSRQAHCFGVRDDGCLIAFVAYIRPRGRIGDRRVVDRVLVDPDYLGTGLELALLEWLGGYLTDLGYRLRLVDPEPGVLAAISHVLTWALCRIPPGERDQGRLVFEYVPYARAAPPGAYLVTKRRGDPVRLLGVRP